MNAFEVRERIITLVLHIYGAYNYVSNIH